MFQRNSKVKQPADTSHDNNGISMYAGRYMHFDFFSIPNILKPHMMSGHQNIADLGCGDGPWFNLLYRQGYISDTCNVYAVDLDETRLRRIAVRFPWISTI